MTPREIQLVQESFRKVSPIAGQAAAIFYARLFELDPAFRALFSGNMAEQGRNLLAFIGTAVAGLDRLDELMPRVRHIGLHCDASSIREPQYEAVGEALLWTLARSLGPDFTSEHQAAWARVYWILAETMKAGARDGAFQSLRAPLATA